MLGAKMQDDTRWLDNGLQHRILRNHAVVVFDFQRKIGLPEIRCPLENDLGQLGRVETVIDIVGDPDLQNAACRIANRPAAIDEVLLDSSHLRDVKVSWNQ